jgi:hypothetical protein
VKEKTTLEKRVILMPVSRHLHHGCGNWIRIKDPDPNARASKIKNEVIIYTYLLQLIYYDDICYIISYFNAT